MAGWVVGNKLNREIGKGGVQKVYIDEKQGANGTKKSLAMDFKLGSERTERFKGRPIQAGIRNQLKRDLSHYSGIKFYMKASKDLTVTFVMNDLQKDAFQEESWFRNIFLGKEWREFRVAFGSLSIERGKAKKRATDQILDLRSIERINWVVVEMGVEQGTEGTIWLDEVTFY